jgi:hypothetical protein
LPATFIFRVNVVEYNEDDLRGAFKAEERTLSGRKDAPFSAAVKELYELWKALTVL